VIENLWVKKILFFLNKKKPRVFILIGNRYVELYFDSPRPISSNHHRSKSNDSPHRAPSKPETNHDSRSRSMLLLFVFNKINRILILIKYSR